ncbi:hypothetical protein H0H92_006558 [Tricholoma furcatifolium]|nr:hypothetical protein H0H92_006558 [Tricholoma furcatifolium]
MLRTSLRRHLVARHFSLTSSRQSKPPSVEPEPPVIQLPEHTSSSPSSPSTQESSESQSLPESHEPQPSSSSSTPHFQPEDNSSLLEKRLDPASPSSQSPLGFEQKPPIEESSPDTRPLALSHHDLDVLKQRLRNWRDHAAVAFRHKADEFTEQSKATFSQLGSELNRVTGYEAIDALKRKVVELEERIISTRQAARNAKKAYDEAVALRSNSQREVNDLLVRKSSWTGVDVNRYTDLVHEDHLRSQEEHRAKAAANEMEDAVEREFNELLRTILARYHEEQVWSDKIRSASTYGSLAALALNMLVFIMAILVVEPLKRRRLAQTFEKKVEELSQENEARLSASMAEIGGQLADQERLILHLRDIAHKLLEEPKPVDEIKQVVAPVVEDVPTEQEVRQTREAQEGTTLHISRGTVELAAVAAGAFAVGIISSLLLGR